MMYCLFIYKIRLFNILLKFLRYEFVRDNWPIVFFFCTIFIRLVSRLCWSPEMSSKEFRFPLFSENACVALLLFYPKSLMEAMNGEIWALCYHFLW